MNVDLLIKENKELNEEKQRYKEMWLITNNLLTKYRELEEQLGCPLEIVFKAIKQGYVWTKDNTINRTELKYDTKANDFYWNWNFDCYFKNYKKTWWLKKDKSE